MTLLVTFGCILLIVLSVLTLSILGTKRAFLNKHNSVVYQDQIDEINKDVNRGLLNREEGTALEIEIRKRFEKAESEGLNQGHDNILITKASVFICTLLIVIVPLITLSTYNYLGSPTRPDLPFAARQLPTPVKTGNVKTADVEINKLANALKKRMESNPEKVDGWLLLGRTLSTLKRFSEASDAFKRAFTIEPSNAQIAVSIAETLFMERGGVFDGESRKYLKQALELNPREYKALYYIGLNFARQNNYREAIQTWVDLVAISPKEAPWLSNVRQQLAEVASKGNLTISKFVPRLKPTEKKTTLIPRGPSQSDIKAAQEMSNEDRQAFIRSMVQSLADRLKEKPNDLNGWKRLARAYRVLGETKKAEQAEMRIKKLEN
jgi:cytochrome c-type biogenesis protein CcmH